MRTWVSLMAHDFYGKKRDCRELMLKEVVLLRPKEQLEMIARVPCI